MKENEIIEKLKTMISERKMEHSLNVRDVAVKLAQHYGADIEKVRIAGILHDCAKGFQCDESLKRVKELGLELDKVTLKHHALLHAPLGAKIAQIEFGIEDDEILNAIKYHTTGNEDMTLIEKIVCLADYIEPGRSFKGLDIIRDLAFVDIDMALVRAFGATIIFVVSKNYILHPTTVIARNSLLKTSTYRELKV